MAYFATTYRPNRATLAENKGSEALWGAYTVIFSKFSPPFLQHPPKSARDIAPLEEIVNSSLSPLTCLAPSCIGGLSLEEQTVLGMFKVLGALHTLSMLVSCFFWYLQNKTSMAAHNVKFEQFILLNHYSNLLWSKLFPLKIETTEWSLAWTTRCHEQFQSPSCNFHPGNFN